MTTTVPGFLRNLLLSGARPLARPKTPVWSSVPVRERSEERAADISEAPLAASVGPPAVAPPPPLAEAAIGAESKTEPEPPEPPPRAEWRTTEVMPVHAPAAAEPDAASGALFRTAKAPDHAPERSQRTAGAADPAELGATNEQEAVDEKPAVPPAVNRAPEPGAPAAAMLGGRDIPPRQPRAAERSPEPRMPVPAHVEAVPPKALPTAAARLVAPREVRLPEQPLPVPRVEFVTVGDRVSVLPKPVAVQDGAPPAGDQVPGSRTGDPVSTATAVEPRPSPERAREPPASAAANGDLTAPAPLVRQSLQAPTPAIAPTAPMPPVRREAENTISIRQLDIQIAAEESRRPRSSDRPNSAPVVHEPMALGRYYVREIP